jgi:hypothetical protein
MRTDLTTAFQTELTRTGRAPVQLMAFYFPTAGTVRVSDRDVGTADGLADDWSGLVEDWGVLEDVTATDPADVTIEARQMAVTLINRGSNPFSDYFLKEDPEGVAVDLFQWFDGLTDADVALIDRFVVADPIRFSERGRLVTLDLVSAVVNMDAVAGGLLSAADWPNAKTEDVGKAIDLPFGNCGRVPALAARTAPAATLNGSILASTMTIQVNEDLDALGFSASGKIQIGEEKIRYKSRTGSIFNVIQRGWQTTKSEHLDRAAVVELVTDHAFIIGRGPVQSITDVKVGGYPAPTGVYTVKPNQDPARILFTEKPYAYRFAAGSSFLAMQFDATGSGNSAVQAYKAYDAADDATAARIDEDHRVLSLKQATVNPDRGAIVKAYLAVEHWESNPIVNDYAEVWVEGVGVVGRLSRPNPAEGIAIDADVDIDHGHSHAIGGEHTHNFHDPTLQTSEDAHTHTTNNAGTSTTYYPKAGGAEFSLNAPYEDGALGDSKGVYFEGAPDSFDGGLLHFRCNLGGARVRVLVPGRYLYSYAVSGENRVSIPARSATWAFGVSFKAEGDGTMYAQALIWDVRVELLVNTEVQGALTGANTQVAISGRNDEVKSDKHVEDVDDLATANVDLNIRSTEASTRSHVNLFDLTEHVAFSWSWFTDRDVKVTYRGSTDNQSIYILHLFFDVEYRKRERFFSDDVSADVVGLIDDGSGTYTGTPSALITRPDHVVKRLLLGPGDLAADRIDAATYANAGARLQAKGYTVDGMVRGDATVKESLKKIAYQTRVRPFWSAGLSKLAFVEALNDWPEENPITAADLQMHSIAVERQKATAVVNRVDLFFARDWTVADDGPAGFGNSVRATDAGSIARFGARGDPSRFRFDLVRSASMASDLAAFYADRFATPSSFYSVNAYLGQFALEKEDKVVLSATFNRLRKAKLRVLGASRVFGSGKNRSINTVALLLECLRYILVEHSEADMVRALDALDVSVGKEGEFSEAVDLADLLSVLVDVGLTDDVTVGDALALIQDFAPEESEAVTVADDLDHGIGIGVEDTVKLLDDAEGWRQFGFGGGEFGVIGFGGWITWHNRAPDEVAVFDDLFVDQIFGPFEETVAAGDDLYIHSGFGCPIGTGFGLSPWGK